MMRLRPDHASSLALVSLLALLGTPACKEDPPPPPPASATNGPLGQPTLKEAESTTKFNPSRTQVPRVDKDTMKRYRVEACFFGAQGMRLLADDYLTSTKGGEPTADTAPGFGEYPGVEKPAASNDPTQRRRAVSVTKTVPFIRYLRYCAIAKSLKDPAVDELDAALVSFNEWAAPISQYVIQSTRYWGTKQYEKDDFKRGKFLHEKLSEALPKTEAQLATLAEPVNAYAATAPETSPEELDEPGKAARAATAKARALAVTFLPGGEAEGREAMLEAVVEAEKALKEAAAKDDKSPFGKAVPAKLADFIAAAKVAVEGGKPTDEQVYSVMFAMADLIEMNQRALNQLLRVRGDVKPGGRPLRLLSPNMRKRIPATPKATPKPAATQ